MVVSIRSIAITAAVISGFAAEQSAVASTCTGNVIAYQVSGHFRSTPISGNDPLKWAGQPFNITLRACEALTPLRTGPDYAEYYPILLWGKLIPGFLMDMKTAFILRRPSTGVDSIAIYGTIPIEGQPLYIRGGLALPPGTLTSTSIAPFTKVTVVTAKSEFTYSLISPKWQPSTAYAINNQIVDSSGNTHEVTTAGTTGATAPAWNETVLGTTNDGSVLWSCKGTLFATLPVSGTAAGNINTPPPSAEASPLLYARSVRVITAHADGSQSVRPLQGAPIDPAATLDRTMLQIYASGVREASEVHVQIGGQDVPVLYAGASGHFPGLDEVVVEVPRSLAGFGEVDVTMTVDGMTARPVRIQIQ